MYSYNLPMGPPISAPGLMAMVGGMGLLAAVCAGRTEELGKNNSGRGVGGSMVHYAGYTPRFHPSDFSTYSDEGVGRARGVVYVREGDGVQRLQRARFVAVAGYSIETRGFS